MRYYTKYDENENLICFGIGYGGTEITEDEYYMLKDRTARMWIAIESVVSGEIIIESVDEDIREDVRRNVVAQFAERVYTGASIGIVPESMREDVQQRVDNIIIERGEYTPEISESEIAVNEALAILHGEVAE